MPSAFKIPAAYKSKFVLHKSDHEQEESSHYVPNTSIKVADAGDPPQGYLNADFSTIGDGKQLRVLVYIGLALVPVLFLVPFFMSRDFVPPTDPSAL